MQHLDSTSTASSVSKASVIVTIADHTGALNDLLKTFRRHNVSMSHIESRPTRNYEWSYDFMIEFDVSSTEQLEALSQDLRSNTLRVNFVGSEPLLHQARVKAMPWFPRRLSDLDSFASKTLEYGAELTADHPGFTDPEYRARRAEITAIARSYRTGQPIPRINYTGQEITTWRCVYEQLGGLYTTHACREHQYVFPLLVQNCGYGPDAIPQLEDVSLFLRECTGFTLRPVMGLLSARDFLNGLAFRVFHSTQYVRHHSKPFYTPEPDVCHELLGHVPLFADAEFAAFSQEIGLCSLGASDQDIEKLATIYWFTVEFGLCKQNGELKAYGAGLLSSFGELEYCLSDKPERLAFDPSRAAVQKYPITQYQPTYFVAENFRNAQDKVREFAQTLDRPFSVRYNPYTQTIELLDTKEKITRYGANIRLDLQTLLDALSKL